MNISRNEVTEFQYASSMPLTADEEAILTVSTPIAGLSKAIRISDIKVTNATAAIVKFQVTSYSTYGQALEFDLPANGALDFHWEIPYKMNIVSSTGDTRRFIASTNITGVKYAISGWIEDL